MADLGCGLGFDVTSARDPERALFALYLLEENAAMMNTVDELLGPVKTGATQTLTPVSRVLYRPDTLARPITLTKQRHTLHFFGRCGRTGEYVVCQIWKSFLHGCELAASVNAKFP
ncbi:MAG: hypothetical protein WAM39_18655 [Bryobacteraceae bacterium]